MGVIGIDRLGCGRVGCFAVDWGWGRFGLISVLRPFDTF